MIPQGQSPKKGRKGVKWPLPLEVPGWGRGLRDPSDRYPDTKL